MYGGLDEKAWMLSGGGTFPPPQTPGGWEHVSKRGELRASEVYHCHRNRGDAHDTGKMGDDDTRGYDALCGAGNTGWAAHDFVRKKRKIGTF